MMEPETPDEVEDTSTKNAAADEVKLIPCVCAAGADVVELNVTEEEALACMSSATTILGGMPVVLQTLPNLSVDTEGLVATLDDQRFENLDEQAAVLLRGVLEAKGYWITGKQIEEQFEVFDSRHQSRAKNNLPPPLRELVISQVAKGYRLRLDPTE